MSVKVLVTGSQGQVGTDLMLKLTALDNVEAIGIDRPQLDLTEQALVAEFIQQLKPDVIINTAAYTAVDKAEEEPVLCEEVNHLAVAYLAKAAADCGAILLHLSTDYVFDGDKDAPYLETDMPNPQSVYGQTKLAAEQVIIESCSQYAIIRTAWVFGEYGQNFVKTMLRLGQERAQLSVVADQYGAPTYAGDIAAMLIEVMQQMLQSEDKAKAKSGIYHYTGSPYVNWYQFAAFIFQQAKAQGFSVPQLNALTTDQYPTQAKRPENSRLDCQKIEQIFGVQPSGWQQALVNIEKYTQ